MHDFSAPFLSSPLTPAKMSTEKMTVYDEKDPDDVYVRPAYPANEVDRVLVDRDEDLAHATEGDHGTKRALVSNLGRGVEAHSTATACVLYDRHCGHDRHRPFPWLWLRASAGWSGRCVPWLLIDGDGHRYYDVLPCKSFGVAVTSLTYRVKCSASALRLEALSRWAPCT